jgi:phytoene dehydrogenase-like protein
MSRSFDALVIGGDCDALAAATALAQGSKRVLLVAPESALGGLMREIEFTPGYRAAPFAPAHDPSLTALTEDGPLVLSAASDQATDALKRHSPKDAEHWPKFSRRMRALAGFLGEIYRVPPPRIDADTFGEFFALAQLARQYRKLGRAGMIDLLRTLPIPIADLLDDEFETPALKGALAAYAVTDIAQGPAAAGTAFTLLHRYASRPNGHTLKEYETQARAAGVTIETGAQVRQLGVRDGRLTGATLASGEEIACNAAISSLDPCTSLLGLIEPKHHDPEFIHALLNIRFRGVATKVLVALDALPDQKNLSLAGTLLVAPTTRYVEKAYEATKYGRCSEAPFIGIHFPTLERSDLAPAGKHVGVLHVQYTPYRLRDGDWNSMADRVAEQAIAAVDRQLPGFASRIRVRKVLTPRDLEATLGAREGAATQGELMLDQILFMRPVPAAARYATPIDGFYLCGAGSHPGPGIHGISGRLAARAALASAH